jgi:hypothetical protein
MIKKAVIRIWMSRPTYAYYNMSEGEKNVLWGKLAKKYEELGIKTIIECKSNWSNEEWVGFGVEEFPDIVAVQMLAKFQLEELEWPRYFIAKTYLGTPYEGAWLYPNKG